MTDEQRVGLHFDSLLRGEVEPVLIAAKKRLLPFLTLLNPEFQDPLFSYEGRKDLYCSLTLYVPNGPNFKVTMHAGTETGCSIKIEFVNNRPPDGPFYLHNPDLFESGLLQLLERCLIQIGRRFDPRPFPLEVTDRRAIYVIGPYEEIMQQIILPQLQNLSDRLLSQGMSFRIYSAHRFYSLDGGGDKPVNDQCVCRFDHQMNFYQIECTANPSIGGFEIKGFRNAELRKHEVLLLNKKEEWANRIQAIFHTQAVNLCN